MYITINNEKYELTAENIRELNRQEAIETARNAIEYAVDAGYCNVEDVKFNEIKNFTDNTLEEIGNDILNRIYSDTGDIEFDVLEKYGIIEED